jgi:hypothetical protein
MVTIVSAAELDKAAVRTAGHPFAACSQAVTAGVGYGTAERAERCAEIEEHLEDMYLRAIATGADPATAIDRAIAGFGDTTLLSRGLWRTRVAGDLRAAWRLSVGVCLFMLADLIASIVWIGRDMTSPSRSAVSFASLLVVFTFATTIFYWVAMALARGGLLVARRAIRYGAPALELVLAAGLLGSAATVLFSLRPGALANVVSVVMEPNPVWRFSWEWAGVAFPALTFVGFALLAWRARRIRPG